MPPIREPWRPSQRRSAVAADPDRRMRALHRQRLTAKRAELVTHTVVFDRAGAPKFLGDRAARDPGSTTGYETAATACPAGTDAANV